MVNYIWRRLAQPLKAFIVSAVMFTASPVWAQLLQFDFTRDALVPEEVGGANTQGYALINQILSTSDPRQVENAEFSLDDAVSDITGPLDPALNTTYEGFAGQDAASVSVTASGGAEETESLAYQFLARELQLLTVSSALDTQVILDMSYSQHASVTNTGGGDVSSLRAFSFLELIDATTFDVPFGTDEVFLPFRSIVSAGNCLPVPCDSETVVDTAQVTLNTNTRYWVQQTAVVFAQTNGSVADVEFSAQAFSDPTFSINTQFAIDNPLLAATLDIDRKIVGVPEPGSLALLGLGLLGLVIARRKHA